MLLPYLVDCIKCENGIVTKHYPDSDEQGNKVYYTEPCDCIGGHRLAGHIDVTDIDDKLNDLMNKCNDIFEKLNE